MSPPTRSADAAANGSPARGRSHLSLDSHRVLAIGLVVVSGLSLAPWPRSLSSRAYELGAVQPTTVIADFDFPVLKDAEQLMKEKAERAEEVPGVVVRSDSASVAAYQRLVELRDKVRALRSARPSKGDRKTPDQVVLPFSQETLVLLLVQPDYAVLIDQAEGLLQDVMQRGFVSPELALELADYRDVRIRDPMGDAVVPTEQLLTADRVRELARSRAARRGVSPDALSEITLYAAIPNLEFDRSGTLELVERAVKDVDPSTGIVLKGEKIIGAHERITADRLRVLQSYQYWRGQRGGKMSLSAVVLPAAGRVLLVILVVGAFVAYLGFARPSLVRNPSDFWLLASVEALVLLLGFLFLRLLGLPAMLVPVASVSILVTLLFDERLALAASGLPLLLIGVVGDAGIQFMIVLGTGAMVTVLLTHAVRERSQFFRHLALLPVVHLAMLGALALAELGPATGGMIREAASVAANPALAAALALFLLPYAEGVFGRSTDISLREFQDLNRPLLRRLMMEAPGTYHHSMLVGALAEAGALAIGASGLLARVIGYYHDIGKVAKPEYYVENLGVGEKSPHDRLNPSMSRLILESHVREGVELARAERLPREVCDGIREHHGTSVIGLAWRKAKRQDPAAKESDYRYPGPRPRSRESALVLLANQVEASARALEEPTPSRIKGMVLRVFEEKLAAGDLDESGLTLSDLARTRDAFTPILTAAFRVRGQGERSEEDETPADAHPRRAPLPRNPR